MVNPLYVSENAPRAVRGGLTGLYQLFITLGIMIAFWINYGSLLHINGIAMFTVPLSMQALPAVLLLLGMLICNEFPRWLAKQDRWENARRTLSRVRNLPSTHLYLESEFQGIITQLEQERHLIAGSGPWDLLKEMWLIPGNRKRAIISIFLMICQQMTGTNAINYYAPQIFKNMGISGNATNLFATGVYGIVKAAGCAVFLLFVADSLGRRWSAPLDLFRPGSHHALYRFLYPRCTTRARGTGHSGRILRARLHFPIRRVLPVRLGACLLGICR